MEQLPSTNVETSQQFGTRSTALSANTNHGAVAIEQERAIAEAQGQLILAKRFPRDLTSAHAELMEACSIRAFAETAFYSVPNRGSGPSIRFAEEVARVFGNFQYGHRELSRGDGKSEVEVFAWDMEKNNHSRRQITVLHILDTTSGPKILLKQADIDNKIANVASKQIRGRILALMPKWLVAEAIEKCKQTIAGNTAEPISVRVRKIAQAFAKYGVTIEHLERHLGHPLDETTTDELVDLIGIGNALKEGGKPSEYFGAAQTSVDKDISDDASASTASALAASAAKGSTAPTQRQRKAAAPAEPAPAATETPPATESNSAEDAPQEPGQNDSRTDQSPGSNSADHPLF